MNQYDDSRHDETAPIIATPVPAPSPMHVPAAPITTPPAGWYPKAGGQRYWDGQQWTEHRAPAAPTGPVLAPFAPAYHSTIVLSDARTNTVEVTLAWIITVLTAFYMLPWAIAATRGKSNSVAIGLVNFLLGWTLIGWLVALVMACMPHRMVAVRHGY